MGRRSRIFFSVGIVLAILVGVAVYYIVTQAGTEEIGKSRVVIAAQDIPERTLLTSSNIESLFAVKEVPVDLIPTSPLLDPQAAVGKITLTKIFRGEIVIDAPNRLAASGGRTGPSTIIPPGTVAMAIPISEATGVAGAIAEGDLVDVVVLLDVTTGNKTESVTQMVLQGLKVLQVGTYNPDAKANQPRAGNTITFLLSRQDALVLHYLVQSGARINLLLRRFDETDPAATEPVTADSLARRYGIRP